MNDQEKKRHYHQIAPVQTIRARDGRGWICPDERCGETTLGVLIPHPDDPEREPNRCLTCLATAARITSTGPTDARP